MRLWGIAVTQTPAAAQTRRRPSSYHSDGAIHVRHSTPDDERQLDRSLPLDYPLRHTGRGPERQAPAPRVVVADVVVLLPAAAEAAAAILEGRRVCAALGSAPRKARIRGRGALSQPTWAARAAVVKGIPRRPGRGLRRRSRGVARSGGRGR